MRHFALHIAPFLGLLISASIASPDDSCLTAPLQQSYEKAVADKATAPYLTAVAELNQKYSTALDRLTASATQAGDLDTALALRDEKKLLLPDGTLPEDADTTPAALKAARATYRQQITALQTTRDAATQPLKDHFRTLLQTLLTQTTQAGKLDEALAIREKIASLSSGPANTPAQVPDGKTSTPARSSKLTVAKRSSKTDPSAAQQVIAWALANDSTVTTSLGVVGANEKLTSAPPGKFRVTEITLGQTTAGFPWAALAGLGELNRLSLSNIALTETETRHFHNLGSLEILSIGPITEAGLQAMPVLPALRELGLSLSIEDLTTLHLLQERTQSVKVLSLSSKRIGQDADAIFAKLSGWQEVQQFTSAISLNASLTQHLASLPKLNRIMLFTGIRIDEGCIPLLPNLATVTFNDTHSAIVLREVAALRNLGSFTMDVKGMTAADFPELSACSKLLKIEIDNPSPPASDFVAKCAVTQGFYFFKLSNTEIDERTIDLLLKFKRLDIVNLIKCRIAPEAIAKLKDLKLPKEISLGGSGISDADFKALQKALPKCKILK